MRLQQSFALSEAWYKWQSTGVLSGALRGYWMVQVRAKEQADLVVTFTVDTATPEETLAALNGMVGSSGQLTSALQSSAGVHLAPDSLREVPPASEA